jgi:hypothetical protein
MTDLTEKQEGLSQDSITFGKYKGSTLSIILKDRSYCEWLLKQKWFEEQYEYLYNRVNEYDPKTYFLKTVQESEHFTEHYTYFNLEEVKDVKLPLTQKEENCYEYYLRMIDELRERILTRVEKCEENPYDIKAPVKWLKAFELEYEENRQDFKDFINSYGLPNIPYIVEDIKKEGGIEYKGAQSFNIAKSRSLKQEKYWEDIMKECYGEDVSFQYKYEKCIFDMLIIPTNTIVECKLGLKDFNPSQHRKYKLTLDKFRIVYIIGYDGIIVIERGKIYTNNPDKYKLYQLQIPDMKEPSPFDQIIQEFEIEEVDDLKTLLENYNKC